MICRVRSHSWLCIPGLLFLVIQYKLVFSYQRGRPGPCINNFKQTGSRQSSFCRFFEHNTNLTICQSCQRMSSLTVGFKTFWLRHRTRFACESRRLWFFCQPVHRACVKMTSRVGKHESSYKSHNICFTKKCCIHEL